MPHTTTTRNATTQNAMSQDAMRRAALIDRFLATHGYASAHSEPLAQDASFRRYLRLTDGPRPAVLMDAPPPEDVRPFLDIAARLAAIGLSVPEILAADAQAGLVLEEDLGDDLLAAILSEANQHALFDAAVDTLIAMQRAAAPADLPAWGPVQMRDTALGTLFDWWWPATFGAPAPQAARNASCIATGSPGISSGCRSATASGRSG
jgi:aminoglycoside/choline kinase family phosphotransferase